MVAQSFSITIFFSRQGILLHFFDGFQDKEPLAAIQCFQIFFGLGKVFQCPAHSMSTSSKSARSSAVMPKRRFISASDMTVAGS